nr:hypothetical protein [Streptomyces sp. WELS2]
MSPTPARITAVDIHGIRFPTSRRLDGFDAMNPDAEPRADPGTPYRDPTGDSRPRRLGPERGVPHMAVGVMADAVWDLAAKGGADRGTDYVDHLHGHFPDPAVIRAGHRTAPTAPGFSAASRPEGLARHILPGGTYWSAGPDGRKGQSA